METCTYAEINNDESSEKLKWKPLLRQVFVCSSAWVIYFLTGLSFGAPTVFIPQIRREVNSTFVMTDDMASWLYSVFGYSGLPWVIILCLVTRKIGRKIPFAIVCLSTLLYYLVFYFSTTTVHLLISEIIQGMSHASDMTLSVIIVSEYPSPRYRGVFLAIKSTSFFCGIWVANAIGSFLNWKYIPLVGIIISFYNLSVLFWPESPFWLASRGRFDECRKAHRWLRGRSVESERELVALISSQTLKKENFMDLKALKSSRFYKPASLSIIMMLQYYLSGKLVYVIYAIDIIKKITNSEQMAYLGMLILDGVTLVGMYSGCILSKYIKRRKLLLSSALLSIIFLFIISLYLYLVSLNIINENKIVTISLLTMFSICISCGPMILSTSIYAEIIPLQFKTIAMILAAMTFTTLSSTLLKLSPLIFKAFDMHGTFLFYAICSLLCWVYLFKYLPETKDKTLQEIEEYFNDGKKIVDDTEMCAINK